MNTEAKTAEEFRAAARAQLQEKEDSFQRCDTDGFLSQWASGLNAELNMRKAQITEAGMKAEFPGLWEGDRRVKARIIHTTHPRGWGEQSSWLLHEDEADLIARRGKKFIPTAWDNSPRSTLVKLGLRQRTELAPAWAKMDGRGTGLSGQAWVANFRTGDKWGQDATVLPEGEE